MTIDIDTLKRQMLDRPHGREIVSIERAPVSNFAKAVCADQQAYFDTRSAASAGFKNIPVPPTYPFAMFHWGNFPELRDATGISDVPANPLGDVMDQLGHVGLVMAEFIERLGPGVCLHAEQEFEYHRQCLAGDVLIGETKVVDLFERQSGATTLTFVVTESVWSDAETGERVVTSRFTGVHRPSSN